MKETREADDRWQRILVPNEEATVTVASIDAAGRDYRVERYLLDAETMAKARETRATITLKSCTTDPDALAGLAAQQDAKIGRATGRERGGQYVWISGVGVSIKKKKQK